MYVLKSKKNTKKDILREFGNPVSDSDPAILCR
jgi:hypothetical protein